MSRSSSFRWAAAGSFCVLVFVLSGCERSQEVSQPENAENPLWSRYITAHTSGLVSRRSNVRVLFSSDVASLEDIGKAADHILDIRPKVKGTAVFADQREISITPEAPLKRGETYTVRVNATEIPDIPEQLAEYEFSFQVLEPDMDLKISGLNVPIDDNGTMVLNGTVEAADVEEPESIEKMFAARMEGDDLEMKWDHHSGGRRHDFTIPGVVRGQNARIITVSWDGEPIGFDKDGVQEVEVPAIAAFEMTQVEAISQPSPHVSVVFSDNLDSRQDLKGLVETNQGVDNMRIEGNVLKIFPEKRYTGELRVTLHQGIRNAQGKQLRGSVERTVTFSGEPPQVRFVGKGVILPESSVLSIPFEAVNVRSVEVAAFRIWENNIGQFLQNNELDGERELHRVGRQIWSKTVHLPAITADVRSRYNLDVTQLLRDNPGGMFRITLGITRANSTYQCPSDEQSDKTLLSTSDGSYQPGASPRINWSERNDPCKAAYFHYGQGINSSRSLLASNIGLLAKRDGRGELHIVATNLRTSEPMKGVDLTLYDFQNQAATTASTDSDGFAVMPKSDNVLYILAEHRSQKGYLRLQSALPVSHFDVGGESVAAGIKGSIYGERGVWRPGDDIHLTFVLQDRDDTIPPDHPVTMTLRNPQGQVTQTVNNGKPVGKFYAFKLKTAESAPTGNWTARAELGKNQFSKTLKIETVRPNRLKVELDLGKEVLYPGDVPLKGMVVAQWLHGGIASELKSDVSVRVKPVPTRFEKFRNHIFDDPSRRLGAESRLLHDGQLDANGHMQFEGELLANVESPGAVQAQFTTRVFERGGAFSSSYRSVTFYPYKHFVGVRMPESDRSWNTLSTTKTHAVSIATVDAKGKPASSRKVRVSLHRVNWRWWWDQSDNLLANFASSQHYQPIQEAVIETKNGEGKFELDMQSQSWGRFVLRACDLESGHCSGSLFYATSPGWARSMQEEDQSGATVLSFFADKEKYVVGETAVIQLPEATHGRALVSIENGTGLLEKRWVTMSGGNTRFNVELTPAMSPNVYVSVTLIQPHAGKNNDRPIRLFGVIPLFVDDPATRLAPTLKAADEWRPETTVAVEVAEASGREMTYTLAVVDEGLLSLTNYKTPDLRRHFYKRETLGVNTWDVFDYVVGAYGGELDRLLAIGGGEDTDDAATKEERRRFPPVVTFLGPFTIGANANATHEIALPQYIGAVRVMLVAGENGAYGLAHKTVPVRQPLSLLASLPRVLGPDEEVALPVSLFSMDPSIRDVTLKVEPDDYFDVVGSNTTNVKFDKPGEQLGMLRLKVKPRIGIGHVRITATSGEHKTHADVNIEIRNPNPRTVQSVYKALQAGETWTQRLVPHGLAGTNEVALEVYSVLPFPLGKRLEYLVRYPYGCLEQTTSSVFPQLYLPSLTKLDESRKRQVEANIRAGIDRLRLFQMPGGSFSYWPGAASSYNGWTSVYAGHFLVEADQAGYFVPRQMILNWAGHQKKLAESWPRSGDRGVHAQAYRLYALSLAKQPALGAMNRLREDKKLSGAARVLLAAAYQLAGQSRAATRLIDKRKFEIATYDTPGPTFGSALRDRGLILSALVQVGDLDAAVGLAREVSGELSSDNWYSTQTLAHALVGLARLAGESASSFSFEKKIGKSAAVAETSRQAIFMERLAKFPDEGEDVSIRNTSEKPIYVYLSARGAPPSGQETAVSKGFEIEVRYTDRDGNILDVSSLSQSIDVVAEVKVKNLGYRHFKNVALTHVVPSGWEIDNERLVFDETVDPQNRVDYRDIRDDRVYTYFGIGRNQQRTFRIKLNAAFLGRYYLPAIKVEPMYEATKYATTTGRWIEVIRQGE